MRSLIGWCPEARQPVDLQLYIDDATLARIWSNVLRFQCPHCGTKHETKVERLASKPFSLEPPQTKRTRPAHRVDGSPSVHPIRGDEIRGLRKLRRENPS
jgi:hypothetical protein